MIALTLWELQVTFENIRKFLDLTLLALKSKKRYRLRGRALRSQQTRINELLADLNKAEKLFNAYDFEVQGILYDQNELVLDILYEFVGKPTSRVYLLRDIDNHAKMSLSSIKQFLRSFMLGHLLEERREMVKIGECTQKLFSKRLLSIFQESAYATSCECTEGLLVLEHK